MSTVISTRELSPRTRLFGVFFDFHFFPGKSLVKIGRLSNLISFLRRDDDNTNGGDKRPKKIVVVASIKCYCD